MNYLSRARRKRFGRSAPYLLAAVIILLSILLRSHLARIFSSIGDYIGSGLYTILPQGFRTARELSIENAMQRREMDFLIAQNADRNILAEENAKLKAGFGRDEEEKIVYANVVMRPPNSLFDTFIIDAGVGEGVGPGDKVIFGSVLIGEIVESKTGLSKAKLLSSPGNAFQGKLGESASVEARGLGGGAFEAKVPFGMDVAVGEALILPSISPKIFGLVQKIEENPEEGFKRVLFSLPVNPNKVDTVGIIIP